MAKYECKVCGYIYNEQHAGRPFEELTECPICNEGKENFISLDDDNNPIVEVKAEEPVAEPVHLDEEVEEVVAEAQEEVAEEVQSEDNVDMYKEIKQEDDTPEFVVERRQEFWSPLNAQPEKKEESNNTTGWTISSAMNSVEKVIGADESAEKETALSEEETEAPVVDKAEEDDDMPAFSSRIESFYSASEPIRTSHIISEDNEEESFRPLWNSGAGTVQRVIDPFGDKNDSVVKAENIGMVMPAEEPVVEEILGEEKEDAVSDDKIEEIKEEEFFFDDEEESATVVEEEKIEAEEVVEESVYEEVKEEEEVVEEFVFEDAKEEEEAVEEFVFEDAKDEEESEEEFVFEDAKEEAEETVEEFVFEDIKEEAEETVEEPAKELTFEEEEDDDFFTEMTMDAVMEPVAEHGDSSVSEEEVFKAIDAIEFVDDVPEGGRIEVVSAEGTEEILFEEEEEADLTDASEEQVEAVTEPEISEIEEVAETVEESVEATEEAIEEAEEAVEEERVGATEEAIEEEHAGTAEETLEEAPRIKAWSFLDDVVEAGTATGVGVAGVNFVTKSMDEVVDEEVTEDDIEEVFVDFAQADEISAAEHEFKANLAEELYEKEDSIEEESEPEETACYEADEEPEEVKGYCNNLEKILIVPAQLNPMPLPEGAQVEGRTVLGIASERPLVLDNPVFSTGDYNMVQYIPNSGLTSEDYQQADAIEVIVGHGNGIEKTINSKEDLRQVVNFLRLESDGCPIGIKMGAARIERDLEFCVFAKPDYVVLNNFDVVPLPYALHRATKYLNAVQSDMDIVIALDGAKDAEELAKIMAMGADVIALRNRPEKMDEMVEGLKGYARITGHYDVEDLNVKDLCTVDREIAEFTDIYHV